MTTYTITPGDDGGAFGLGQPVYGVYPETGLPGFPPGFGSIAPSGSGIGIFVWTADGSTVAISGASLPAGSEVQWLGQTYVLSGDESGGAFYEGPGLGGTYPTAGTTSFDLTTGTPTISAVGEIVIPFQVQGGEAPTATGEIVIAFEVQGNNLPAIIATGEVVIGGPSVGARGWAITGTRRVVVLRSGPGLWTVPIDWNPADNRITTIGAAGNGAAGPDLFNGGASGATGAFMRSTNLALTVGSTHSYDVGPGKHAWFGGASLADAIVGSEKGGNASGVTPGTAGLVANSRGATGVDGTAGTAGGSVSIIPNPGAAPGAPGPGGAGAAGQKLLDGAMGGRGGGAAGGLGGGVAADGYPGTDYGDGIGSGGGGGTGSSSSAVRGGTFGGAGPGSPWGSPAGIGDGGAIIISWAPIIAASGEVVIGGPSVTGFAPTQIAQASGAAVIALPVVQSSAGFAPITAAGALTLPLPVVEGRQRASQRRRAIIICN
ncbi:hypothetical protein [Xanthobacter flavus]|uniref:hypothetical protein n=1 Tax=Xanthobacter flavus TaxID=281 RepID=UPI00372C27F1